MFSFFQAQHDGEPSNPNLKQEKSTGFRAYDTAVARYKSRHPDASDSDIDLIRKEGGDLENLYLWGVDPLDMDDAIIIAGFKGENSENVGEPSEEQKASVMDRDRDLPSDAQVPAQSESATEPPAFAPSMYLPTFGLFGAPTTSHSINNVPPTQAMPAAQVSTTQAPAPAPVTQGPKPPAVPVCTASAAPVAPDVTIPTPVIDMPSPPSLYLPTFGVFDAPTNADASAPTSAPTLASAPAPTPAPAPAPASASASASAPSLFPFNFDLSPRTSPLPAFEPPAVSTHSVSSATPSTAPSVMPASLLSLVSPSLVPPSLVGGEAETIADGSHLAPGTVQSLKKSKYSPYIYFTVFDDPDADQTETSADTEPDPLESFRLRALRDQEEIKALKGQLSDAGKRPSEEIEFFRKQLADIEIVHSKCFDVRKHLGAVELQLSKVQSELREKSDEVIRLKCDDAGLRLLVAEGNNTAALVAIELQNQKEENKRQRVQMEDAERHSVAHTRQGWDEAERRQLQVGDLERQLAVLQRQVDEVNSRPAPAPTPAPAPPSPNGTLLAQLERTTERAAHLEDQNRLAQRGMDDLFKQLTDISRQKVVLENQARSDQETIAALQSQLSAKAHVVTEVDKKRLVDLADVNSTLLALAKDSQFRQDLERPLVKVALTAWSGASVSHISAADMDAARYDEGVGRIYPRLKAFEAVCDAALIRFPVDHIQQHRTELSAKAVVEAFGSEFVAIHLAGRK